MTDPRRPGGLACDEVRDLAAGFVLDALTPDEAAAVRSHLADCPEAHAEMLELASALPILAAGVPEMAPSAGLKDRIMAAAAADLAGRTGEAATPAPTPVMDRAVPTAMPTHGGPSTPVAAPTPSTAAGPIPAPTNLAQRRRPSLGAWALGLAAVLAIVAIGGWNLSLQRDLDAARMYERNVAAVLDVAARDGSLAAVLTPAEGDGPSGFAAVGSDGQVRIAMRALPATHGEQVYETWVIGGDGVPLAVGGFRVGADGTGFFEATGIPAEPGIVLALTLEPEPGRTAPSGAPVSLGTVTAAG